MYSKSVNTLDPGQDYEELPDSYVIFITKDDVLGNGLPIYHVDRVIEETRGMFGDGSHIIYVNSSIQDKKTALGRLVHDLNCKNADEMYSEVLAQRVSELKETEMKENVGMCDALEKLIQEENEKECKRERKRTAKALCQKEMSIEEIAQILSEEEETVKEWLAED